MRKIWKKRDITDKMVSKNRIKAVQAFNLKKNRDESNLFVAEGPKVLSEMLPSFRCRYLAATSEWLSQHRNIQAESIDEVTPEELKRLSLLRAPQQVLAVFEKRATQQPVPVPSPTQLFLALDEIQDPGNLGTIVRLADWFGIEHIVCSPNTADVYNPKTVQATMGALARVSVHHTELPAYFASLPKGTSVYGTFLDGKDIYQQEFSPYGIIVMGNEGNGISREVEPCVTHRLYIPSYPSNRATVESLNVSIATAVTCAEFRRRTLKP